MKPTIDRQSPIPLGEQLQAQIRLLIHSGRWAAGELLPTVKELAARLGLNYNTVAAAYRALEAEGYLVQRRRAGTRVAPHPPRDAEEELMTQLAAEFAGRLASLQVDVGETVKRVVAQAALEGTSRPWRVAVLSSTPLQAAMTAERAAALLGDRCRYVPQGLEQFQARDCHLAVIDPAFAEELRDAHLRRANRIPPYEAMPWHHDAEFPAGAD